MNLAYLERNIRRSGLTNVTVHRCAVGEKVEVRQFRISRYSDGSGFYSPPDCTFQTLEMPTTLLDDLIVSPVHLIKIDVEGAEIEVLNGMKRILKDNPSLTLIVEWFPEGMRRAGRDPFELPSYLERHGFRRLEVLADLERQILSLATVRERLAEGNVGKFWYCNILARRQ